MRNVPLVVSWRSYGTRIEVATHCWLVSLEGACCFGRFKLHAGYPAGFRVVLPVLFPVGLGCRVLADVGSLLKLQRVFRCVMCSCAVFFYDAISVVVVGGCCCYRCSVDYGLRCTVRRGCCSWKPWSWRVYMSWIRLVVLGCAGCTVVPAVYGDLSYTV